MPTSKINYHDVKQGSPEWFALRKGKVTASNADKLLLGGKKQLLSLPEKKFSGNFYTQRGSALEPSAIALYEQITGTTVKTIGGISNDDYPDCWYSPDGYTDNRLIEVKCFQEAKHERARIETPFEVMAQMQFGMMVANKKVCDLVLYNPDIDDPTHCLYIVPIDYDERIIDHIRKKLKM
jgi:hypothetical protein